MEYCDDPHDDIEVSLELSILWLNRTLNEQLLILMKTYTPQNFICGECEYFDRGAMGSDDVSDCLNRQSPRFQTERTWTCSHWVKGT